MAVEYQVQDHLFEPRQTFQPSRSGTTKRSKAVWFKFNFLHDLESVLWIYLWFLLDTLPAKFTLADREVHRTVVLKFNEMLLDGSLRCSSDRLMFMQAFQTDKKRRYGEIISALTGVHGVDSMLLKALNAFQYLVDCYGVVQSSQPLLPDSQHMTHWDRKVFLHAYYEDIRAYFMDVYEEMKDTTEEALPIWYTDQEDVHRAQQAVGPSRRFSVGNRPNKRPRTGTDVPPRPVREDENDEEEDFGEQPSPTAASQDRKTKRKRTVGK